MQDSSSRPLFTCGQFSGFFFHTWPTLGPFRIYVCKVFQDGLQPRGRWGGLGITNYGVVPPTIDPQGAFLHMCNVSFPQGWPLDLLLKQGLALSVFAMTVLLKCPQVTKTGYLLFLLLFLFPSANGRLVVYPIYLSIPSLAWSPSIKPRDHRRFNSALHRFSA